MTSVVNSHHSTAHADALVAGADALVELAEMIEPAAVEEHEADVE